MKKLSLLFMTLITTGPYANSGMQTHALCINNSRIVLNFFNPKISVKQADDLCKLNYNRRTCIRTLMFGSNDTSYEDARDIHCKNEQRDLIPVDLPRVSIVGTEDELKKEASGDVVLEFKKSNEHIDVHAPYNMHNEELLYCELFIGKDFNLKFNYMDCDTVKNAVTNFKYSTSLKIFIRYNENKELTGVKLR